MKFHGSCRWLLLTAALGCAGFFRWRRGTARGAFPGQEKGCVPGPVPDAARPGRGGQDASDRAEFLQAMAEAIPLPVYAKDGGGVYRYCNAAFERFLGLGRERILGKTASDLFDADQAEEFRLSDEKLRNGGNAQTCRTKLRRSDGSYRDVTVDKTAVRGKDGAWKGLSGVIADVTKRKRSEEKIEQLMKLKDVMIRIGYSMNEVDDISQLLQMLLDELIRCIDEKCCGSILLLDQDDRLRIAVEKGYRKEDAGAFSVELKEHLAGFNHGTQMEKTVIVNGIDRTYGDNMLCTEDGSVIRSAISSPIMIGGKLYGFVNLDSRDDNIFSEWDVELMEYMRNQAAIAIEKHRLYEETLYLSRYDKLTDVYNRSYFEQVFDKEVCSLPESEKFLVAVFDMNGLKRVNDGYGHLAGDELIRRFAKGLAGLTVSRGFLGRYGGDEFVAVFFECGPETLRDDLEGLLRFFRESPVAWQGGGIVCDFSYGIASFPEEGKTLKELIKAADERMYAYKRNAAARSGAPSGAEK